MGIESMSRLILHGQMGCVHRRSRKYRAAPAPPMRLAAGLSDIPRLELD